MPSDTLAVLTQPVVQRRPDTLFAATLTLVQNRPRHLSFRMIANATGLSEAWLKGFATGKFDGGVTRVQCLWEYMTQRKLDVDHPISAIHHR